jgi:hypothetical protein
MYVKRAAALRAINAGQGQVPTTVQQSFHNESQMRVDPEQTQNTSPDSKDPAASEATRNSDGSAGLFLLDVLFRATDLC